MALGYNIPISFSAASTTTSSASLNAGTTFNFQSPGTFVGPNTANSNPQADATAVSSASNGPQVDGGGHSAFAPAPGGGLFGLSTGELLLAAGAIIGVVLLVKHLR